MAVAGSDAAGAFRFIILESGAYDLVATHADIGIQVRPDVVVTLGASLSDQDITTAGDALTVVVTNDAGGYAFAHLAPGDYTVTVAAAGLAHNRQTITHNSGGSGLDVSLAAGQTVMGLVESTTGEPVADGYLLFIRQSDGQTFAALTDDGGAYSADYLSAGAYDVWVISLGRELQPQWLANVVVGGAPLVLDATLGTGGASLSGQVTATGAPANLALVTLLDAGEHVLLSASTGFSGTYALERLPAGSYTLRVTHEGFQPVEVAVSIPAAGSVVEDVALGAAQAVAAAPAAGLPEGTDRTGNGNSASLASWLETGLIPPSPTPGHASFDLPPLPPNASVAQTEAYVQMVLLNSLANEQFNDWQGAYENMQGVDFNNQAAIALNSTALAGKSAALGLALNAATGGSASAGILAEWAAAAGVGQSFSGLVSNITNELLGGNFDKANGLLDSFSLLLSEAGGEFAKNGGGIPMDMFGLAKDAAGLFKDIQDTDGMMAALQSTTAQERDWYLDLVRELMEARARFHDLGEHEEEEDNEAAPGEPPPDEDEEVVDEDTTTRRTSQDPNDITGPAGYGPDHWLQPQPIFPYTIQFENVMTAAAPAQEVFITQLLDDNLDYL